VIYSGPKILFLCHEDKLFVLADELFLVNGETPNAIPDIQYPV